MLAVFEAMLDVIVNEFALGVRDRLFHGVELLREFKAGATFLDHRDQRSQMAIGAF